MKTLDGMTDLILDVLAGFVLTAATLAFLFGAIVLALFVADTRPFFAAVAVAAAFVWALYRVMR